MRPAASRGPSAGRPSLSRGPIRGSFGSGEGARVGCPGRTPRRAEPAGWSAGAARGTRTRRHPRSPRGGAGTGSRPARDVELRFPVREARSQPSPAVSWGRDTAQESPACRPPASLCGVPSGIGTVLVNTAVRGLAGPACPLTQVLSQPRATRRGAALTTAASPGPEADGARAADLALTLLEATVFFRDEERRQKGRLGHHGLWQRVVRHAAAPAPPVWALVCPGSGVSSVPAAAPAPQDPAPKRGPRVSDV